MIEVKERESFMMASVRASMIEVKERESFMMERAVPHAYLQMVEAKYVTHRAQRWTAHSDVRRKMWLAAGRVRSNWMSLIPEACASRAARLISVQPLIAIATACRLQRRILRVYQ